MITAERLDDLASQKFNFNLVFLNHVINKENGDRVFSVTVFPGVRIGYIVINRHGDYINHVDLR